MIKDGRHHLTYDDGDTEELNLSKETWRFLNEGSDGATIQALCSFELERIFQSDLQSMFD